MATTVMENEEAYMWEYRGEGAANIVLEYVGSNLALAGKVLRIRKIPHNHKVNINSERAPVLTQIEQSIWADWPAVASAPTIEMLQHAYMQNVMLPLLGEDYVEPGVLVAVSPIFLTAVAQKIQEKRPDWRREVGDVDLLSKLALLISDHTKFSSTRGLKEVPPTIAVEIKPKCGFLPTSTALDPGNVSKKKVSRFAMHQHFKYVEGKLNCLSTYNPLDLFSGTYEGIHRAIESLFKTPQNNLRVFINGVKLLSGVGDGAKAEVECMRGDEDALPIVEDSLEGFMPCPRGDRFKAFQALLTELFYRSDILKRLLSVQKLDAYDIEGAIHVYYDIMETECNLCLSNSQNSGKELEKDMTNRAFNTEEQLSDLKSEQLKAVACLHSLSPDEKKKILRDFLVSATAKDCSIILALQPASSVEERSTICCPVTSRQFIYKMFFLDLDLKHLKKMPFYYELDQNIVKLYTRKEVTACETRPKLDH